MIKELENKVSILVVEDVDYNKLNEGVYDDVKFLYQENIPLEDADEIAEEVIPICLELDVDFYGVYSFVILKKYSNIDTTALSYKEAEVLYDKIFFNDFDVSGEVKRKYDNALMKNILKEVIDEYFSHEVTQEAITLLKADLDSLDKDKIADLMKLFINNSAPIIPK